ncbi:MAG: DUF5683 domain-containing protein [Bacteroidota bacterium]|nr:DUF5683 domain-containing protein [Bacteroidota bacterium]
MFGQIKGDTITLSEDENYHSPRKATLYSTFIPGWGQAYNKKYWIIPIIYAGFGGLIYSANWNNGELQRFKKAFNDFPNDEFNGIVPQDQLIDNIDYYRRNRDLSFIGMFALWGINVLQANVDAHFYNYDISRDLSLKIEPVFRNKYTFAPETGLKLTLNF